MPSDKEGFALTPPPKTREFLGVNKRTPSGESLFPKLGSTLTLKVVDVETFTRGEKTQPALILEDKNGNEYIRPLGVTAQYILVEMGFKSAEELIGHEVTFESYETGNTGQFAIGLRIAKVE